MVAARRLARDRTAVASAAALLAVVLFGLLAPLLAQVTGHPYHQTFPRTGLDRAGQPVPPGGEFWLGSDDLGRDVLVRAAYGARVSLLVGFGSTALATLLGVAAGMAAGYARGAIDHVLSRLMDAVLSFPYVLVAMALAAAVGTGTLTTILLIGLFSSAAIARTVRARVMSIRRQEYVTAARALGAGPVRVLVREVLPNIAGPVTVLASLLLPAAIGFEATLSYLGAGTDPSAPSWGAMLDEAQSYYRTAWWFPLVPAALLLVTTLACNLLGDALRDALAPGRKGGAR